MQTVKSAYRAWQVSIRTQQRSLSQKPEPHENLQSNWKGIINYILIAVLLFTLGIFLLDMAAFTEKPVILLPVLWPFILVTWIYFDTSYKIVNDQFIYRYGF